MPSRAPPQWKLIFPRMKCPHCKKLIAVAFYGRYRFGDAKIANRKMAARMAEIRADSSIMKDG